MLTRPAHTFSVLQALMMASSAGRFRRLFETDFILDRRVIGGLQQVPLRLAYPAPTTAANLGSLHRRAHRLKTVGLLSLRQPIPGVFEWTTSTGHTYQHQPEPLPVADWKQAPWFVPEFLHAIEQEIHNGYTPST